MSTDVETIVRVIQNAEMATGISFREIMSRNRSGPITDLRTVIFMTLREAGLTHRCIARAFQRSAAGVCQGITRNAHRGELEALKERIKYPLSTQPPEITQ